MKREKKRLVFSLIPFPSCTILHENLFLWITQERHTRLSPRYTYIYIHFFTCFQRVAGNGHEANINKSVSDSEPSRSFCLVTQVRPTGYVVGRYRNTLAGLYSSRALLPAAPIDPPLSRCSLVTTSPRGTARTSPVKGVGEGDV